MKRVKTIISITVILFTLCNSYSCRADETDLVPKNETSVDKKDQNTALTRKGSDSVQTTSNLLLDDNGFPIADPPPRDRDQWKY